MSSSSSTSVTPNFLVTVENGPMTPTFSTESLDVFPRASLECRPNSHPFQDRNLVLDQAIKVGRSVARARPGTSNAIFDCKVLSRNHALIWYEDGKFYLQDTKSSNGTFVNNQRLSKGSEESLPREVCSGDILQFGVDVMENSRQVTHGCIIATLKLFLPDGKEAKASPTIMNSSMGGNLPPQDLYLLNQYIQEALAREQLLETKLAMLQRLVGETEVASHDAWSSLIDEDRLLTRVEILESQLSAYSKNMTEDKLREETQKLMKEKEEYQEVAKNTLRKVSDEKLEVVKEFKEIEKQLSATEDELGVLRELFERESGANKKLEEEIDSLTDQLMDTRRVLETDKKELTIFDEPLVQPNNRADGDQVSCGKELQDLLNLKEKCSQLENDNKILASQLALRETSIDSSLDTSGENMSIESSLVEDSQFTSSSQVSKIDEMLELSSTLEKIENEKQMLIKEIDELRKQEISRTSSKSQDTEEKVVQLLKYKEKCAHISQEKDQLESSILQLESEVELFKQQNQAATACSLIPLGILLLSLIVAYLPFIYNWFRTSE